MTAFDRVHEYCNRMRIEVEVVDLQSPVEAIAITMTDGSRYVYLSDRFDEDDEKQAEVLCRAAAVALAQEWPSLADRDFDLEPRPWQVAVLIRGKRLPFRAEHWYDYLLGIASGRVFWQKAEEAVLSR